MSRVKITSKLILIASLIAILFMGIAMPTFAQENDEPTRDENWLNTENKLQEKIEEAGSVRFGREGNIVTSQMDEYLSQFQACSKQLKDLIALHGEEEAKELEEFKLIVEQQREAASNYNYLLYNSWTFYKSNTIFTEDSKITRLRTNDHKITKFNTYKMDLLESDEAFSELTLTVEIDGVRSEKKMNRRVKILEENNIRQILFYSSNNDDLVFDFYVQSDLEGKHNPSTMVMKQTSTETVRPDDFNDKENFTFYYNTIKLVSLKNTNGEELLYDIAQVDTEEPEETPPVIDEPEEPNHENPIEDTDLDFSATFKEDVNKFFTGDFDNIHWLSWTIITASILAILVILTIILDVAVKASSKKKRR